MKRRNFLAILAAGSVVGACSNSKFKTYRGPAVTGIVVNKGDRDMFLLHNGKVLKSYKIDLGFAPAGDKQIEGDGKTPEGTYLIDRRNPNSKFHLSLGISYPNADDIAQARALGKSPGGDIFIHGQPNRLRKGNGQDDWTWGCIAVTNREMEDIYAMVRNGTPITINP
ncbi:MAG: murein L,D-transpeptidase family protein [Paracoccaceae bacterium]